MSRQKSTDSANAPPASKPETTVLIWTGDIDRDFLAKLLQPGLTGLVLSSPGGSTSAMAAALDRLRISPLPVTATGQCRSAAVPIIAWGQRGDREATRLTSFTVHPGSFGVGQDLELPAIEQLQKFAVYTERVYAQALAQRTRRSAAWWLDFGSRERDFDAREAKRLGLIDRIV